MYVRTLSTHLWKKGGESIRNEMNRVCRMRVNRVTGTIGTGGECECAVKGQAPSVCPVPSHLRPL